MCDLTPTSTLVFLLSALTRCCDGSVRPSPHVSLVASRCLAALCVVCLVLSSALLLGYKLCHLEIIKMQIDEARCSCFSFPSPARQRVSYQRCMRVQGKRLDAERADLIAELEATLAPDVANQVEAMLQHHTHRPSIIMAPLSRSSSSLSRSSSSTDIVLVAEPTQPHALTYAADRHIDEGAALVDKPFDVVVP